MAENKERELTEEELKKVSGGVGGAANEEIDQPKITPDGEDGGASRIIMVL